MDLLTYLTTHYLTRAQLLDAAGIDSAQLDRWQAAQAMPLPSYRLRLGLACTSVFGAHEESADLEFYAPAYVGWLAMLGAGPADARAHFLQRYRARLASLELKPSGPQFNAELDAHLESEWQSFLDGTYGLCTRTGLPEQIAVKEAATAMIKELLDAGVRDERLRQAVDLLDAASSPFAPHERARSSRQKYVTDVRLRYGWATEN